MIPARYLLDRLPNIRYLDLHQNRPPQLINTILIASQFPLIILTKPKQAIVSEDHIVRRTCRNLLQPTRYRHLCGRRQGIEISPDVEQRCSVWFQTSLHYQYKEIAPILLTQLIIIFAAMIRSFLHMQNMLLSTRKIHKSVWMQLKANIDTNEKLKQLESYDPDTELREYFANKYVKDFTEEDIYFYMVHKNLFAAASIDFQVSLMMNRRLDNASRFQIAHETDFIKKQQVQQVLIDSFNSDCRTMPEHELASCLKYLQGFQHLDTKLDFAALSHRMEDKKFGVDYLEIAYQLFQMDIDKRAINRKHCIKKIKQLKNQHFKTHKQALDNKMSVSQIYFLEYLQRQLNIPCEPQEKQWRQSIIEKDINSHSDLDKEQSIKILEYYPQFTYYLQLHKLSHENYIRYLHTLQQNKSKTPHFVVVPHEIPQGIIQYFQEVQFATVIKMRVALGLDSIKDLGKKSKKYFRRNLKCVSGLLEYLVNQNIEDPEVWLELENAIVNKLSLNSNKKKIQEVVADYDIIRIMKLLAYMNKKKCGSSNFWKNALHFFHNIIMEPSLHKLIERDSQNMFIICSYAIYGSRSPQAHIEQGLKKLTLIALLNNFWNMTSICALTSVLSANKIGDDELWWAIQNKILSYQMNFRDQHGLSMFHSITKHFHRMKRGSSKFWFLAKKYEPLFEKEHKQIFTNDILDAVI